MWDRSGRGGDGVSCGFGHKNATFGQVMIRIGKRVYICAAKEVYGNGRSGQRPGRSVGHRNGSLDQWEKGGNNLAGGNC